MSAQDEASFFVDALTEYQWARDSAGLAPSTIDQLIKPVIEDCDFYGTVPWHLTPRDVDKCFAGPGKRAHNTHRQKLNHIDAFFAFLDSATPTRSGCGSGRRWSHRSTRSTGRSTVGTSGCGSRPRRRR